MFAVPSPMSAPALRWGILGAGFIGGKFVNAVTKHTRSTVTVVASRDLAKAEKFGRAHGVPGVVEGYEALVADPDVDAIYVATPHSHHSEHALLAINHGKPVLVEKPFTRNLAEGSAVVDAATRAKVFAMEAMWSRFLPHTEALRQVIARGEIGEVVHVHAEHGQHFPFDPKHRIHAPELAGGALLDLGVYPLAFIQAMVGAPSSVVARGHMTELGVDGQVSMILDYDGTTQASAYTTLWGLTGITATITGTEGRIEIHGPFLRPASFTVWRRDGVRWDFDQPVQNGFQYEAAEVARCLAAGAVQSDIWPLSDTLHVLKVMDEVRSQIGVRYPGESPA